MKRKLICGLTQKELRSIPKASGNIKKYKNHTKPRQYSPPLSEVKKCYERWM